MVNSLLFPSRDSLICLSPLKFNGTNDLLKLMFGLEKSLRYVLFLFIFSVFLQVKQSLCEWHMLWHMSWARTFNEYDCIPTECDGLSCAFKKHMKRSILFSPTKFTLLIKMQGHSVNQSVTFDECM